jgi:hypothetical protein
METWTIRMVADLADAALALRQTKRSSGCWCDAGKDVPAELHTPGCQRAVWWLKRRALWLKGAGKEQPHG